MEKRTFTEEHRRKLSENHVGMLGLTHSEETRKKMSLALQGKTLSEEHRRKLSLSHQGKTLSEETKNKMSALRQGVIKSEEHKEKLSKNHKNRISVICLNDGQVFHSISRCAKHYNISQSNVSQHLLGRRLQVNGLTFAYHNEEGDR